MSLPVLIFIVSLIVGLSNTKKDPEKPKDIQNQTQDLETPKKKKIIVHLNES